MHREGAWWKEPGAAMAAACDPTVTGLFTGCTLDSSTSTSLTFKANQAQCA